MPPLETLTPRRAELLSFYLRIVLSPEESSRPCVFQKIFFHGEELLAPDPTPKLENHSLSAVRHFLFNLFAATLLIGSHSSSATWGRPMPWWKEPQTRPSSQFERKISVCFLDSFKSQTSLFNSPWVNRWCSQEDVLVSNIPSSCCSFGTSVAASYSNSSSRFR